MLLSGPLSARGINPERHPALHEKEVAEMKRLVQVYLYMGRDKCIGDVACEVVVKEDEFLFYRLCSSEPAIQV